MNYASTKEETEGSTSALSMVRVKVMGSSVFASFSLFLILARHSSVARTGTLTAKTHAPTSFIGHLKVGERAGKLELGSSDHPRASITSRIYAKERNMGSERGVKQVIAPFTGSAKTMGEEQRMAQ
jgi:hypothetical protein